MKVDFSKVYGELHYSLMVPRIICEEYLDDLSGELPYDYKVYCFSGRAHCTMVCAGRGIDGYGAKYAVFDREGKTKLPYDKSTLRNESNTPKPEAYEEMINIAEELSKPFPFVRLDFYCVNNKPIIGEMTFTPSGCIDLELTDSAQDILGNLIKLPEKLNCT